MCIEESDVGRGGGGTRGEEWMESSREVLVLPVIFIKPG